VRSLSGYVLPPFFVLERGMTLKEWNAQERNYFEIATMVENTVRLLATLHGAGLAHRDLKPDNVLYLLQSTKWRLLDLGIVARIGA
jgi:serine/threonine protein kinase